MYAQDLLRRSYQDSQIDPQILMQFGQGMPRQTFEPPAPAEPQVQQYLQPSPQRMEYANLVEQRFQEIANMVGGMDMLVKTGRIDKARQAAMEDVAMIYGPAPAIEKAPEPYQTFEVGGKTFARGGIFGSQVEDVTPVKPEAPKPSEAMNTVLKKSADYISTVDPMLGQLESAILQNEDPNIDPATKLSNARTLGKLINSLQVGSPDAVGAEEARTLLSELNENILNPKGFVTSETVFGTNLPRFNEKMKLLRDRVAEQYNKQRERVIKADPTMQNLYEQRTLFAPKMNEAQTAQGQPQSAGSLKREVWDGRMRTQKQ